MPDNINIIAPCESVSVPSGLGSKPLSIGAYIFNVMKEIKLNHYLIAKVDDEDYEFINQFGWYAHKGRNSYYAVRDKRINKKKTSIKMARVIMNTPKGLICDHINHDGLDNRKSNLRNCTVAQNNRNRKSTSLSGYLGVSYANKNKKYCIARIYVNNKKIYLGSFTSEIEAAKARDVASRKYFKEYAGLNFND
jgi:hypothetical protein